MCRRSGSCSLAGPWGPLSSDFFRAAPRFIAAVAVFTLVALALAFGLGALLSLWSAAPVPTLILGTTPGGIAEMAITAKVLQLGFRW